MDVVQHFGLAHDPFKAGADREFGAGDGTTLGHEDSLRFVATRTAAAGRADLFSPAALEALATAARGRPAALRLLAGNAMFHAAFDGAGRVEDMHARQAVATQDIWRDVPDTKPAAMSVAPVAAAATAPRAAEAPAPVIAPTAAAASAEAGEPPPQRGGWWRGAPPLARLAILVGLLLLSLPVIGYVVGAVKDERPAADSSYLPDEEEIEPEVGRGREGELADAEAPIDPPTGPPPAAAPDSVEVAEVEPMGNPPQDLTAQTTVAEPEPTVSRDDPVAVGAGEAVPTREVEATPSPDADAPPVAAPAVEPQARPEPAQSSGNAPRVFVHYSASRSEGADVAAGVARRLRAQGFDVVDIRAVPMAIETASVRYFFPDDRAAAESLHDELGRALRPRGYSAGDLKSMTGYDPAPRRGTLEVWVPAG